MAAGAGPPDPDTETASGSGRARGAPERVPFGAVLLLVALALVFGYGIYLKAAAPAAPPPVIEAPGPVARYGAAGQPPGSAPDRNLPISGSEPRPSTPAAGGTREPIHPIASETPAEPLDAGQTPLIPDSGTGSTISPPTPSSPASVGEAEPEATPGRGRPAPGTTIGAPRRGIPSAAERKARELFHAQRYVEAARAWKEWAQSVPAGAWTVQIAALHIDRPQARRDLAAIAGREGVFLLPAGVLPGNLAPVCVGVYPSADQAKQAAGVTGPFPRSASRPFAKLLSQLTGG